MVAFDLKHFQRPCYPSCPAKGRILVVLPGRRTSDQSHWPAAGAGLIGQESLQVVSEHTEQGHQFIVTNLGRNYLLLTSVSQDQLDRLRDFNMLQGFPRSEERRVGKECR